MSKKCLVGLMGFLLVLGLGAPASAAWVTDTCGDAIGAGHDIAAAKVEVFDDSGNPTQSPWIYLCSEMCPGSGIPGIEVWEFDVDQNTESGGAKSMLGIPLPPCICKITPGFDIVIMKALRGQGTAAAMGKCNGCFGLAGKQCATRGPECDSSGCYELDEQCVSGAGCYQIGDECTGYPGCYPMDTACPSSPCGIGALAGDWQVSLTTGGSGGGLTQVWGRDIPAPAVDDPDNNSHCEKLPYGEILRIAHARIVSLVAAGELDPVHEFDLAFALANPPKFEVSTYFDSAFADEDDYVSGFSLNVTDWLPNGDGNTGDAETTDGGVCHQLQSKFHCCLDTMAGGAILTPYSVCSGYDQTACEAVDSGCFWKDPNCLSAACLMEASGDGRVTAPDYAIFKKEFGRAGCPIDCD